MSLVRSRAILNGASGVEPYSNYLRRSIKNTPSSIINISYECINVLVVTRATAVEADATSGAIGCRWPGAYVE